MLELLVNPAQGALQRAEALDRLRVSAGRSAEQRCRAAHRRSALAQLAECRQGRPQPALTTMPLDEGGKRQLQRWRGLRHGQAPQTEFRCWRPKKGQGLVTTGIPVWRRLSVVHARCLATQRLQVGEHARAGCLHGCGSATQAQIQMSARRSGARFHQPATGVQGQGLSTPAVQQTQGRLLIQAGAHQGRLRWRAG